MHINLGLQLYNSDAYVIVHVLYARVTCTLLSNLVVHFITATIGMAKEVLQDTPSNFDRMID